MIDRLFYLKICSVNILLATHLSVTLNDIELLSDDKLNRASKCFSLQKGSFVEEAPQYETGIHNINSKQELQMKTGV